MKKIFGIAMALATAVCVFAGCSGGGSSEDTAKNDNPITVVSREDGSGTRGAFIELFGVEQKDENGEKKDYTIATAEITQSTAVMITTVSGNKNAIGYISLGSLNDSVTAVEIDGAAASVDNIKNGTYKVSRPFNVATKGELTNAAAADFMNFILSTEGQAVVEKAGYIPLDNTQSFTSTQPTGKVTVGGSSSVTPVMEKLKEAYKEINPNVTIEVQQNDSTTGMTSTIEGLYDIGMASRELKDSELEAGLVPTVIATDGIAVIVNNDNSVKSLTSDQVKKIYTGEITNWSELG